MKRPVHVCIVTTAHPYDDVRVRNKFWQAFNDRGYEITWVGPDYAFFDSELRDGERTRFQLFPHKTGRLGRLLAHRRARETAQAIADVDVYYAPDLDSAPIALNLARTRGSKVVFDIHEVFHGAMLDRWLGGMQLSPVREYVRRRVAKLSRQCDLTIAVSKSVLDSYGELEGKCLVVRSCSPSFFAEGPPANVCANGRQRFTVMHGKSELGRGALTVMEALSIAKDQVPGVRAVMFDFFHDQAGSDRRVFNERCENLGLNGVIDLRPSVPMQKVPEVLRECDAGLISYGRRFGADSLPNRLFEYMAAGLPVVAPVYAREIAGVVEAERCGLLADFENPRSVADALISLHSDPAGSRAMGQRARAAFLERHNWESEVGRLLDWIEQ